MGGETFQILLPVSTLCREHTYRVVSQVYQKHRLNSEKSWELPFWVTWCSGSKRGTGHQSSDYLELEQRPWHVYVE
jgi:hypothetical protein